MAPTTLANQPSRSPIDNRESQAHQKGSFTELFPHNQVYGLRVLYTPPSPLIDIIFTHGLTGHPYSTWAAGTDTFWPTQLLPRDIPNARILSFGYDADVMRFFGPVGQNSVREHAGSLISDLAAVRAEDDSVIQYSTSSSRLTDSVPGEPAYNTRGS